MCRADSHSRWGAQARSVIVLAGVFLFLLIAVLWLVPDDVVKARWEADDQYLVDDHQPEPHPAHPSATTLAGLTTSNPASGHEGFQTVAPAPPGDTEPAKHLRFKAIAAGLEHTCGMLVDGEVVCWGGVWPAKTPAPAGKFQSVSPGGGHSCGIRPGNSVECWGGNAHGQATAPDGEFRQVSAGRVHTCGLRPSGRIECWGRDLHGATTAPAGTFKLIGVGYAHGCGVKTNGSVVCWGYNDNGQSNGKVGRNCSELGRSWGFLTPHGEAAKYETFRVIQPDPLKREQLRSDPSNPSAPAMTTVAECCAPAASPAGDPITTEKRHLLMALSSP